MFYSMGAPMFKTNNQEASITKYSVVFDAGHTIKIQLQFLLMLFKMFF